MKFKTTEVAMQPEILKRKLGGELFEEITLDDTAFTDGVCKAGQPIDKSGKAVNGKSADDNTGTAADDVPIGILLTDVSEDRPIGTIVRAFACVNETNANKNAGITISSSVKTALPLIVFE